MAQMGFYFDQSRCTGCYTCVVACKDWYDIAAAEVNLMRVHCIEKGVFPDLSAAYLAAPCYHCAQPPCIPACPEGAISKRETDGIVVVDPDRCVGQDQCPRKCRKACPWDAPQFGPEPDAKMQKCQLCLERLEAGRQTICVEACPMFALDAGPLEDLHRKYGDIREAEGFRQRERIEPSVTFKPKE
ncbi:4Fe-4S dicluster domain-containing protein [Desulfatitalea alkaliphila]|uniref:4Fe-4S dicluster domain-containing protein n=1 Tax=Desulfatitalea alkaliphila TaxID=2929485 RepID=A0AA41R2G0_9BACT|nr:4Fe-4S dicluster domain-containing protein [Desulfatitalea alkaliphila]MCJ8501469.1 4Fe-4S dicluster domain-containing protein [Desulfatitalea alkaliphila]